ncbi:GNAT family N-acetyltransferase [Nocardia testacea]|uniref:GNAT family N-acetyltransferase n=1 Tax=Nocardia testacea TaxID=248551 RepID=UPI0003196BEB|nr:GNAT family protein [Nocardia testacea]
MNEARLLPLTENNLHLLLERAVADADPLEVMPPVPGTTGWDPTARAAFLEFHRSRSVATPRPVESTYVIVVDEQIVGAARLEPLDEGRVEVGAWIGRSRRGGGIGAAIMDQLLTLARDSGARQLVACTTAANRAACRLLDRAGADLTVTGPEVGAVAEL